MTPQTPYADIHIHPTTKPLLLKGVETPWTDLDEADPLLRYARTARITGADFTKLMRANVRVVGAYLITPERYVYSKLLTSPKVLARYFGMELKTLRNILTTQPFKLLKRELAYLKKHLHHPEGTHEAVIVKNFAHLQETLAQPDKLALVLGVEGAHNLGFEYCGPGFPVEGRIYNFKHRVEPAESATYALVDERVAWMKRQHVFWFTLNHFVYNHLASMTKAAELTGWKKIGHNPYKSIQVAGLYRGLTHLGHYMAERCMENRIVLDVKHADAVVRHQVYHLARQHGQPVVASHVAFSGRETNVVGGQRMLVPEDFPTDRLKRAKRFNPWDINLHDDDIVAIHQLGGLMGLILDERILASATEQRRVRKAGEPVIHLLFQQIEHAYMVLRKAGNPPEACLDSLCLGSDFDGFIEPIPTICTVDDYRHMPDYDGETSQKLDIALLNCFRANAKTFLDTKLEPEEMVLKILNGNAMRFLERWL